jgi:hypothetical protein
MPCARRSLTTQWTSDAARNSTTDNCGRVWVSTDGGATWLPTDQPADKVSALTL